jgi:hypothetical protein
MSKKIAAFTQQMKKNSPQAADHADKHKIQQPPAHGHDPVGFSRVSAHEFSSSLVRGFIPG